MTQVHVILEFVSHCQRYRCDYAILYIMFHVINEYFKLAFTRVIDVVYIYIYVCVCVCVCVREREREREREKSTDFHKNTLIFLQKIGSRN